MNEILQVLRNTLNWDAIVAYALLLAVGVVGWSGILHLMDVIPE